MGRPSNHLDTTLIEAPEDTTSGATASERLLPALVLVWSRDEPERIGEVISLPPAGREPVYTIGRAITVNSDGSLPLTLGQVRPSGRRDTGPLRAAHISRRQLAIRHESDELLQIEHTGRGNLRLNGHVVSDGVIGPGALIEVENRFTLLYCQRPLSWIRPRGRDKPQEFPYGEADPWGLVGESPAIWTLRKQATFLASRDEHALILGPSGSGKELLVQAIHGQSKRAGERLIARNAATIPEALIDAELFGNLRNYPNAGMPERSGLLGESDGSTLFLDEVGELRPQLQAHLLRVMDHGEYQRLGEPTMRTADVRIIAATNRDPDELKHDLLARFPHRLVLPGLDRRPEDVLLIARHLLRTIAKSGPNAVAHILHGAEPQLAPHFVSALVGHAFTTHVRELSELLWRALQGGRGPTLEAPPDLLKIARPRPSTPLPDPGSLNRAHVVAVLERCAGVKEVAWRELGLRNRYQLHRILKKLKIE